MRRNTSLPAGERSARFACFWNFLVPPPFYPVACPALHPRFLPNPSSRLRRRPLSCGSVPRACRYTGVTRFLFPISSAFYIALAGLPAVNPRPRSSRSARRHCPHELQLTYYSYVLLMFHAALSCLAFPSHRRMPCPPHRGAFVPPPPPRLAPVPMAGCAALNIGWWTDARPRHTTPHHAHVPRFRRRHHSRQLRRALAPPRDGLVSSEGVADGPPRAPSQPVECPSAATASRRANLSGMPHLPACLPA